MIINSKTTMSVKAFKKLQNRIMMTEQELLADLKHNESELARYKKLLSKAKLERNETIYKNSIVICEDRISEIKNEILNKFN